MANAKKPAKNPAAANPRPARSRPGIARLDDNAGYTPLLKYDPDLGDCYELPLSALIVNYGGYEVLAPQVGYQCPEHFEVLPHKLDGARRTIRIAICPQLQRKGPQ